MNDTNKYRKDDQPDIERVALEWRSLIDSITEPVSVHDEEFRIIRANRAFADLVGCDIRELAGKRCYEVLHRKTCPPHYCPATKGWSRSRPVIREVYDEELGRHFNISISPLRYGQRRRKCFVHIISDITKRKRAEIALKTSEARLQSIIDNTSAVIYLKDMDGRFMLINRQFEKLFNVKKKTIVGMTDHDLFPADQADRFRKNDLEVARAGRPMEFDETAPHRDGLHHYISVKFPLFDSDGRVSAVCGISTDITARKAAEAELEKRVKERTAELSRTVAILSEEINARRKTEAALKKSEQKYKSMFDGSPIPLLELDISAVADHMEKLKRRRVRNILKYIRRRPGFLQELLNMMKLVDVNDAMVELYGARDRNACLRNFREVFCEESRQLLTEQAAALFEGRREMEFGIRGHYKEVQRRA
jgi:PAS domain S-box-containing protein